uniref:Uncharacterized protein n=1 Tax=Timspurckia oligopyrenoides TaxID=708627 RepID=A0A7S0ZCU2_9RHOD|mmetsp:Transcript_126/g.216  ORF Transcript_126/g.216 Transcript_126/m.216 type:complete len:158 (+) Transcript_126:328-801(+)
MFLLTPEMLMMCGKDGVEKVWRKIEKEKSRRFNKDFENMMRIRSNELANQSLKQMERLEQFSKRRLMPSSSSADVTVLCLLPFEFFSDKAKTLCTLRNTVDYGCFSEPSALPKCSSSHEHKSLSSLYKVPVVRSRLYLSGLSTISEELDEPTLNTDA